MIRIVPWPTKSQESVPESIFASTPAPRAWEIDIRFRLPGEKEPRRKRVKSPFASKAMTTRYAQELEAQLFREAVEPTQAPAPFLAEFFERFIEEYAVPEQLKPSTIFAYRHHFSTYIGPVLGRKRLNELGEQEQLELKKSLRSRGLSANTVNAALQLLRTLFSVAVRKFKLIKVAPCDITLVKTEEHPRPFYEFEQYARLVACAGEINARVLVMVLLGGDAGLRRNEMLGLAWGDFHANNKLLVVQRSVWEGVTSSTKSRRVRYVEVTDRLFNALEALRLELKEECHNRRGPQRQASDSEGAALNPDARVLSITGGRAPAKETIRKWMKAAQARAGVAASGGTHILRHTYCTLMAMSGAPVDVIAKLAGHADTDTTKIYTHVSSRARREAVSAYEARLRAPAGGPQEAQPSRDHQ
jgi:integrase